MQLGQLFEKPLAFLGLDEIPVVDFACGIHNEVRWHRRVRPRSVIGKLVCVKDALQMVPRLKHFRMILSARNCATEPPCVLRYVAFAVATECLIRDRALQVVWFRLVVARKQAVDVFVQRESVVQHYVATRAAVIAAQRAERGSGARLGRRIRRRDGHLRRITRPFRRPRASFRSRFLAFLDLIYPFEFLGFLRSLLLF